MVKSYNAEQYEAEKIKMINQEVRNLSIRFAKTTATIDPVVMTIFILDLFVIFVYGGSLVERKELSLGSLIAFCLYLFQIITPIVNIGNFFKNIKSLNQISDHIETFLAMKAEHSGTLALGNALQEQDIIFDNLRFRYGAELTLTKENNQGKERDTRWILQGISLTIKPRTTIAIVGPSGSGKSTIFSLLERFYDEFEGSLTLGGTDVRVYDLVDWRNKIAYVPKIAASTEDSIRSNLTYGIKHEVANEVIDEALKKVGMYDHIYSLAQGLDTRLQEKGSNFSSGQLQRLMIARGLIKQTDVLLLDEVTASLGSENEKLIKTTLDALKGEKTVIIIAHRLSTVQNADEIIFLDNGEIAGKGTHEQLLCNHSLYKQYVENQLIKSE